jgi:hypothetical protein
MPTKTKQVLDALETALEAEANCPPVERNQVLPADLPDFRGVTAFASLLDGDADIDQELLGAGEDDATYEIEHTAILLLAVEGDDIALRDTVFDDVFIAIAASLEADRSLGVSDEVHARVVSLEQETVPASAGTGVVLRMAEVGIAISFVSNRPF